MNTEHPPTHTWQSRRPVPSRMLTVLVLTALLSVGMLTVSEMGFNRTAGLTQQQNSLTEARLGILQMQQDVQKAMTIQWAHWHTHQPDDLHGDLAQASRQALMQLRVVQNSLKDRPALSAQAQQMGNALHAFLDEMGDTPSAEPTSTQISDHRARMGLITAYIVRLNQALLTEAAHVQSDIAETRSAQRTYTAALVGLHLLFIFVLGVNTVRYVRTRAAERLSWSKQAFRFESAIQTRNHEVQALASHLQHQSVEEKAQLARELHDELGAMLTTAKMDVQWLQAQEPDLERTKRLGQLSQVLDQITHIKRRVVDNLYPSLLAHLGLIPALNWYVQETCDKAGLIHHVQMPHEDVPVARDISLALYRVVQEALNNTISHARAHEVRIALNVTKQGYDLMIQDDGAGLGKRPERFSHGLAGMRHRVMAVGGLFNVSSTPGQGTCIEVQIPRAMLAAAA